MGNKPVTAKAAIPDEPEDEIPAIDALSAQFDIPESIIASLLVWQQYGAAAREARAHPAFPMQVDSPPWPTSYTNSIPDSCAVARASAGMAHTLIHTNMATLDSGHAEPSKPTRHMPPPSPIVAPRGASASRQSHRSSAAGSRASSAQSSARSLSRPPSSNASARKKDATAARIVEYADAFIHDHDVALDEIGHIMNAARAVAGLQPVLAADGASRPVRVTTSAMVSYIVDWYADLCRMGVLDRLPGAATPEELHQYLARVLASRKNQPIAALVQALCEDAGIPYDQNEDDASQQLRHTAAADATGVIDDSKQLPGSPRSSQRSSAAVLRSAALSSRVSQAVLAALSEITSPGLVRDVAYAVPLMAQKLSEAAPEPELDSSAARELLQPPPSPSAE